MNSKKFINESEKGGYHYNGSERFCVYLESKGPFIRRSVASYNLHQKKHSRTTRVPTGKDIKILKREETGKGIECKTIIIDFYTGRENIMSLSDSRPR